jgi:hypothetical protein
MKLAKDLASTSTEFEDDDAIAARDARCSNKQINVIVLFPAGTFLSRRRMMQVDKWTRIIMMISELSQFK